MLMLTMETVAILPLDGGYTTWHRVTATRRRDMMFVPDGLAVFFASCLGIGVIYESGVSFLAD